VTEEPIERGVAECVVGVVGERMGPPVDFESTFQIAAHALVAVAAKPIVVVALQRSRMQSVEEILGMAVGVRHALATVAATKAARGDPGGLEMNSIGPNRRPLFS
jgi:hypothetical protein